MKYSNAGRKKDGKKGRINLLYHQFNKLHGFVPKASSIARFLRCSRHFISASFPNALTENKGEFIYLKNVKVSKEFDYFLEQYADHFGISRAEALQSYTYNVGKDLKIEDFKKVCADIKYKAECRDDADY